MKKVFWIEDDTHADVIGEFLHFDDAVKKLRELEKVPWNQEPNTAPCVGAETCGREYIIIEYSLYGKHLAPTIALQLIKKTRKRLFGILNPWMIW